jgi:putative ABC transport system permease protein
MFADTLRELGSELRAQKLRTLLSLLGIAWGTFALILLLAFSFGFERLFLTRARGLGDAVAIAWPQRTTRGWQGFPAGRLLAVRHADALALAQAVPELDGLSAEFATVERARVGGGTFRIPISGVDPPFSELRALAPQPGGRFPNARDAAQRARVVFLGDTLARTLFGARDPIGRTLTLRGMPFTVVGVMQRKEQDSDYGGRDENRAYVPATTFLQTFGERGVTNLVFRARDAHRQAECSAAMVRALAARLRFDPADEAALSVWDTTEQTRMLGYIFLGFHVMLALGGGFTLLVGGLGVAHLMQLLVRRRTTEIGLKLAVGATPTRIRNEWLLQTIALVASGAGGGALLAVAGIAAVRGSPATAHVGFPYLPPAIAILTASALAAVAFAAGAVPARRAARLDPIAALRGGA